MKIHNFVFKIADYKITYFRAPYGRVNNIVTMASEEMNYKHMGWNCDINEDVLLWSKKDIKNYIQSQIRDNKCIILLHENKLTVEHLKKVILAVKEIEDS
jgi:peptidoglycan/xylan/chitin deacetylase (PgdA/CDA1 family)